jgi:hypothetical protein
MARGPSFGVNKFIPPVNNVDVYPLLCELIKIECHPHNGSIENFKEALRGYSGNATNSRFQFVIEKSSILVILFVILNFLKF